MSADQLVKTLLVQGGYYPDRFAEAGRPPDVFFTTSSDVPLTLLQGMDDPVGFWMLQLAECVDIITEAIVDKYKRRRGIPWEDIFWTASTRITKIET